jgi:hypothetical protein
MSGGGDDEGGDDDENGDGDRNGNRNGNGAMEQKNVEVRDIRGAGGRCASASERFVFGHESHSTRGPRAPHVRVPVPSSLPCLTCADRRLIL